MILALGSGVPRRDLPQKTHPVAAVANSAVELMRPIRVLDDICRDNGANFGYCPLGLTECWLGYKRESD